MPVVNVQLVFPMIALVFLTIAVLVVTFRRRVAAVKTGKIPITHFKTYTEGEPPADIVQAARHYANLFEAPVLFYVACLVGMVLPVQGIAFVILAWLFVIVRAVHAVIHMGQNKLFYRMRAFFTGIVILVAMWIMILAKAIQISALY